MQYRALLEGAGDRACQRHFEPVEDPGNAERQDDQGVKPRPWQPVEPRRDVGVDDRGGAGVGHDPLTLASRCDRHPAEAALLSPHMALEDAMGFYSLMPLTQSLGVEVAGIDLAEPVDEELRQALSEVLATHLVLVFRNQRLTPEQYLEAARVFGPPIRQHYSQHLMPGHPDIGLVWHRNGQRAAEMWHTDHTNRERPPAATILYGVEIPSVGGATSVANMRAAFADLSDEERRHLAGLRTVNSLDREQTETRDEDFTKYGKPVVQPMVRTHPVHGTPAVFFHITKAMNIEGMTPEDSKAYMR